MLDLTTGLKYSTIYSTHIYFCMYLLEWNPESQLPSDKCV